MSMPMLAPANVLSSLHNFRPQKGVAALQYYAFIGAPFRFHGIRSLFILQVWAKEECIDVWSSILATWNSKRRVVHVAGNMELNDMDVCAINKHVVTHV